MNKTLEILFDSSPKIRLIRFFVRNTDNFYSAPEIAKKLRLPLAKVNPAIKDFELAGFLKKKSIRVKLKKGSVKRIGYVMDSDFYLAEELKNIVVKTMPYTEEKMTKDFLKLGKMKLVVLAGIFLNSDKKRVDLFLVGDKINKRRLNNLISNLEVQIGKSIDYSLMDTKEFNYRYKMFDRFVRDIFEYPNKRLIEKIKI